MLDGHARVDELAQEIAAWQAGDQRRPLHEVLGLGADELLLVARTPDALRYLLHARRFGLEQLPSLGSQARVVAHASRLAAEHVDPFVLAELEGWQAQLSEQLARARPRAPEPTHA